MSGLRPAAPAIVHDPAHQVEMERLEYAKRRSVLVLTPVYRNPHWDYSNSLIQTRLLFERLGMRHDHYWLSGLPIHRARNQLAAIFLSRDFDTALLIDDDMGWDPTAALRVVSSRRPFVGAAGRKRINKPKSDPSAWCAYFPQDADLLVDDMGAITAKAGDTKVGAAFVKLSRAVFEKLIAFHPDWKLDRHDDSINAEIAPWYYRFFEAPDHGGEDFQFCERYQDVGGKVWIDTSIKLRHWGESAFEGALCELQRPA
jgi:hypothetical protein